MRAAAREGLARRSQWREREKLLAQRNRVRIEGMQARRQRAFRCGARGITNELKERNYGNFGGAFV